MKEFKDLKIAVAGTGYVGLFAGSVAGTAPSGNGFGYRS